MKPIILGLSGLHSTMITNFKANSPCCVLQQGENFLEMILTFDSHYCILMTVESEVIVLTAKMGRPTDNPKPYKLTVRVDENSMEILRKYSQKENVSIMEAIRRGIAKLEPDLKK